MNLAILDSIRRISNLNLKRLRERNRITQKQVAEYFTANGVSISDSTISRWESDPSTATADDLSLYLEALGFLDIQTPPLELVDPFSGIYTIRDELVDRAKFLPQPPIEENVGIAQVPTRPAIATAINTAFSRPIINVAGSRDAGKSTFINSLLGKSLLPTGRLAVSQIPTLVRHSSSHHDPASGRAVYVVSRNDTLAAKMGRAFSPVDFGGSELLDAYTHNSNIPADIPSGEIGLIIVYDSAPILLHYDFLDLPGLGDNSEDTLAARIELEAALAHDANSLLFLLMPQDHILAGTDKGILDDWIKKVSDISLIRLIITKCADPGRPLIDLPRALAVFEEKLQWPVSQLTAIAFYQPTPAEWQAKVNIRSWSVGRAKLQMLLEVDAPTIFRERFHYRLNQLKQKTFDAVQIRTDNISALSKRKGDLQNALAKLENETLPAAEVAIQQARERLPIVSAHAFDTLESNLAVLFNALENAPTIETLLRHRFKTEEKDRASRAFGIIYSEHISKEVQSLVGQAIMQIQTSVNKDSQSMDALGTALKDVEGLTYIDPDGAIRSSTLGLVGVATFGGVGGISLVTGAMGAVGMGSIASVVAALMPPALILVGIRLLMKIVTEANRSWEAKMAEAAAAAIRKSSMRATVTTHLLAQKPTLERRFREALDTASRTNRDNLVALRNLAEDSSRAVIVLERYRTFKEAFSALPWPNPPTDTGNE